MRSVLDDLAALERMIDEDSIESGIRRVGAEQEMFLVDANLGPALVATEVLETLDDEHFTTELAKFNLECNLEPQVFGGHCLSELEKSINGYLDQARAAAAEHGAEVLLTGILPTLQKHNLGLDSMTPMPRYAALNDAMRKMRGGAFRVNLQGIDELDITHDNVMLEACNTSFQVHFQVGASEFARLYNVAQAVTGPVMAAAVNSPLLLGNRLWHETRVGLFQQSVDARSGAQLARGHRPRVSFGDSWVKEGIIELFREDISRFRAIIATDKEEDALQVLEEGGIPKLVALRLHNGTVYRWNRPCYGIHEGKAHLRVENRVLPAGPTVIDEVANAAFFYGLMAAVLDEYGDIDKKLDFDIAKDNFFSAARYGLHAQLTWVDGRPRPAAELVGEILAPLAREGLRASNVDGDDIDRYIGVVEERVARGQTGAQWALSSLNRMSTDRTRESRLRGITRAIRDHQWEATPVHEWPLAELRDDGGNALFAAHQTVGQLMTTELFTVHEEDLVDLAASLMDWEQVRHIPVEDDEGRLVGILTHRDLLRLIARGMQKTNDDESVSVAQIMRRDIQTVTPETTSWAAIQKMRKEHISCLPVVEGERLVGIITERDFLDLAAQYMAAELGD
jgi:CBS domain-containing protein